VAGPVPIIGDAPDVIFRLPRGLYDNGSWHREVIVRELTGADEEVLAKVPDQLAFFTTVIALGVESIGTFDFGSMPMNDRKGALGELLLGERDQLFMKVAQTSFGDNKEISFVCTACQAEQDVTLILSEDFKPREVGDIKDIYTFTTSKGDVLDYRPAIGSDQEEAVGRKGATLAEQNTIMLSRCVTKRNGNLIPDPTAFVRNLGIKDRQALLSKLVECQPSISLVVHTNCASCGGEQSIALGWQDIFRP